MPLKSNGNRTKVGGLAKKFIVYILLFSSFITLLGTSLQLYLDYIRDMGSIETGMEQIERSYKQTVVNSLWVSDMEQLRIQLQGILNLPDMQYVAITKNKQTILDLGSLPGDQVVVRSYPLNYPFKGRDVDLGVLEVYANLEGVYQRLFDKVFVILATQAIKTFLVSFFIIFLFYTLVGRHLEQLARYTKDLTLDRLDRSIELERKHKKSAPDELDMVVEAMNAMRINLIRDIEERVRMEKALTKSQKLLNTVIEGTTDVIFVKDLEGRYILANEATAIAVGKPKEQLLGKTDRELFPEQSAQVVSEADQRVITTGKPYLAEERLETSFGEGYWLANKSPLFDENGKVVGVIGISRDITELKRVEEEKITLEKRLRQSLKMEAIGTLAGGIAHDFNNILGIILGYSVMAKDEVVPESKLARDLDRVIKAGNRAKELVKQILVFSRQADIERIPLQLQPLIKEVLKMLRASIPATIEIRERVDPECGVVLADPTQIHQILMNLCTNAHHAMEDTGGILEVELKKVFIGKDSQLDIEAGEYVELVVSDTGSGIGPDVIDKIFDPYFTTKAIGKGTGMGLAVIQGIVSGYGGTITVESTPGTGSRFHVYLPVIVQETLPAVKEIEDMIPRGEGHILFVDDEEMLTEMYRNMLESIGYKVTVQSSGPEALTSFQGNPDVFDVVVTDQTMPGMTGLDLSREILAIRPDIPIILYTGYSDRVNEQLAKSYGVREFAMKPLSISTVAKLLHKILNPS